VLFDYIFLPLTNITEITADLLFIKSKGIYT